MLGQDGEDAGQVGDAHTWMLSVHLDGAMDRLTDWSIYIPTSFPVRLKVAVSVTEPRWPLWSWHLSSVAI